MTVPILRVRDLECGYDTFCLKDINFTVDPGEFLGIIGPNGSGKTSLLRALTRILKPRQGEILLQGENLKNMSFSELARKVAVVSQGSGVSHILVEDFVLLGRIPHHGRFQFLDSKRDLEIAATAMAMTGTDKLKGKLMGELSGGERQLALIARALAQEPEMILLDEPTTFLDITHQVRIMDLIKRLNLSSGVTVIVVLHDLNLAGEYCNRLLLMKDGRVFTAGTPDKVLTYQTVEAVYGATVVVGKSPVSSRPYIFVVTEDQREKFSN